MKKIAPWMYGAGALAVAGVGVAIYEITKKPAAAPSTGATLNSQTTPQIPPAARPPASAPGTFNNSQPPPGPIIDITSGGTVPAGAVQSDKSLTVALPAGAKWSRAVLARSDGTLIGEVTLGADLTSPISLTYAQLASANVLATSWTNAQGTTQLTYVTFTPQKIVHLHA